MKFPRRQFLRLAGCAAMAPATAFVARAETYPARPVRIVVGFAAGGGADLVARLLAQWLSQRLERSFIVENRPGAGGNIAIEAVVRAPPDGYTLLLVTLPAAAVNASLYPKLSFNFIRDVAPVASLTLDADVMEVTPSVPAKSVPEFIAYAKANPGKIKMASAGVGSGPHIAGELFRSMAGLQFNHVPYRGSGPALIDLLSGRVDVLFDVLTSSIEYIRAGKLRALAVTSAARPAALPDLPTVGEFVPGYEASNFRGIGAPRQTPREIIERLNREINAALADPGFARSLTELGATVIPGTPADFGRLVETETEKWARVVQLGNIKAE